MYYSFPRSIRELKAVLWLLIRRCPVCYSRLHKTRKSSWTIYCIACQSAWPRGLLRTLHEIHIDLYYRTNIDREELENKLSNIDW
jgi:hypothetical protein